MPVAEPQGVYDYAVFGDSLNALISAFLLRRQEERVLVIEALDPREQGRLLPGLEKEGLLHGLLKRWGVPDDFLDSYLIEDPIYEIVSSRETLSIRSGERSSLGSLNYELRSPESRALLESLSTIEATPWVSQFHQNLLMELRESQKGLKKWRRRSTADLWEDVLSRTLRAVLGSAQVSSLRKARDTDPQEKLLRLGVRQFMRRSRRGGDPERDRLLLLGELHALRRTPISNRRSAELTAELKHYLAQIGVDFLKPSAGLNVHRTESRQWSVRNDRTEKKGKPISAHWLVLAQEISEKALEVMDEVSRKALEKDLNRDVKVQLEWSSRVSSEALPFGARAEVCAQVDDSEPVQFSILGSEESGEALSPGESLLTARVSLTDLARSPSDPEKLRLRFERILKGVFPELSQSSFAEASFKVRRVHLHSGRMGIRTHCLGAYRVNEDSFPEMGAFGPFVASIELARIAAQRARKELML